MFNLFREEIERGYRFPEPFSNLNPGPKHPNASRQAWSGYTSCRPMFVTESLFVPKYFPTFDPLEGSKLTLFLDLLGTEHRARESVLQSKEPVRIPLSFSQAMLCMPLAKLTRSDLSKNNERAVFRSRVLQE
jgi:hypothetical protein